ncbi:MAG TPA: hypothetical protein VKR24_11755 [Candidatus Limnocylindrales bacterium]|nr:hypothetical protein [Candidatus Limnocylindrales bacterium]
MGDVLAATEPIGDGDDGAADVLDPGSLGTTGPAHAPIRIAIEAMTTNRIRPPATIALPRSVRRTRQIRAVAPSG